MNEIEERINRAVGDVSETERLLSSEWASSWTTRRAKNLLDEFVAGTELTPKGALHHALLIALQLGNELHAAKAESNALKKRLEELQSRQPLTYEGVWTEGREYPKRIFVTDRGSVWYSQRATSSRPGDGPDWTLAVKRGKDAR